MGDGRIGRRAFLGMTARRGLGMGLATASLPAILAACSRGDSTTPAAGASGTAASGSATGEAKGTAIVGDVLDHRLTSSDWQGAFGWVRLRLHEAVASGEEAWFIRTDASDEAYARREGLVFVPKLSGLAGVGLVGDAYVFTSGADDQPTVLSSLPGRDDYTPAWRVTEVTWNGAPSALTDADAVRSAIEAGDLAIAAEVVANMPVVAWKGGAMPVDADLVEYLGGGQLIEPPDTAGGSVLFKLHECFPGSRYIVCDTSAPPMADGMHIAASPRLAAAPGVGATGVNVFMGGVEGSGPMGGQPSVFDSSAGEPAWSPYWDHMTYAWPEGAEGRVLTNEAEVHAARDAGELEEFPGTPDTNGEVFTVNCPVPVIAANTFEA